MSSNETLDACTSLADPIGSAVGATYGYGAEQIGLDAWAPAIDHLMSDFVGGPNGGWAAVCETMFGPPDVGAGAAPASVAPNEGSAAATSFGGGISGSHDAGIGSSHDTGSASSHDSSSSGGGTDSGGGSSGE